MSHARVRNLFAAALVAANESVPSKFPKGPIPIMFDNVESSVTPEDLKSKTHITTHLLPADTYSDTLGGDIITYIGVYQMTVHVRQYESTDDSDVITDELSKVFKLNKKFDEKDENDKTIFSVQVISPVHMSSGRRIDDWWVVPCSIEYRADTSN